MAQRVLISNVVGLFVPGDGPDEKGYWVSEDGECPFCEDGVLCASDNSNIYHCFHCGAHGGTIDFLMEVGGHTFAEAVEFLRVYIEGGGKWYH